LSFLPWGLGKPPEKVRSGLDWCWEGYSKKRTPNTQRLEGMVAFGRQGWDQSYKPHQKVPDRNTGAASSHTVYQARRSTFEVFS
jgi:hypothetical protein